MDTNPITLPCSLACAGNYDKGKLMLQVRQVISLVTLHPYLPFCRPYIKLNFDRKYFWVLFLLLTRCSVEHGTRAVTALV